MRTEGRYIAYGQICLYIGLLVAIMLKPSGLATNSGISYFGTFQRTFLPYAFGLLAPAYFCYRAASLITRTDLRFLKICFYLIAPLTIIIVATPYSVGTIMNWLHTTSGTVLFVLELILSAWICRALRYNAWILSLALSELLAGIGCAYYVEGPHGFLIQFQIVFQILFGLILLQGLSRLIPPRSAHEQSQATTSQA